jgi:hypothetical protein
LRGRSKGVRRLERHGRDAACARGRHAADRGWVSGGEYQPIWKRSVNGCDGTARCLYIVGIVTARSHPEFECILTEEIGCLQDVQREELGPVIDPAANGDRSNR